MSTVLKAASDQELRASLFDRWKNRPLPDPNRPRPVIEAIKAMLTQFVAQAGPTLMPMILEMLTKALGTVGGATPSSTAEPSCLAEVSDVQIVEELSGRCGAQASVNLPEYDWFKALFLDAVNHVGPVAIGWVIEQLQTLFAPASE